MHEIDINNLEKYGLSAKVSAEQLAQDDYLEYADGTLKERAIPCVFDNCKPVQRRILYSMYDLKIFSNENTKKCARIVGDVIGRFQPTGDTGTYGALVTMVRSYINNTPYIIGQGGFGTQDTPENAAYRYTECKLSKYSEDYLLRDLKYNAVEMIPNFDEEYLEPKFLPAVLPDILINGNTGIATPYMTWIPPHNAVDAIKLCIKYIENPDMSIREMINVLKAPDFPTGGVISQMDSVYRFYNTGNGACTISGKWYKEVTDSKTYIVISEIPYMRTLDTFMDQLAKIKADKDIGYLVAGVDDFSADGKIYVRIRVSTGTKYDELLQILLKKTCLRYSQVMNMMVLLEDKQYKLLNLKEVVEAFVGFRSKCLYNKFKFEIETNDKRMHILDGLVTINKDIERAIQIVRKSSGKEDSIVKLMKAFDLTREQAEYIVMMRVYRLSNLEMKNVKDEINAIKQRKKVLEKLTSSERNKYLDEEMIKEWTEILDKKIFSNKRKTEIQKG